MIDFRNSALEQLEVLDIVFQLHTDAFAASQVVSQFHPTVHDKSLGRTEVVKG